MAEKLRIGTRASPLAMAQAHEVRDRLIKAHAHLAQDDIEIVSMTTKGDQILDRTLAAVGGKGLFTKELEDALLDSRVDLVVHSTKDMPTELPDGLILSAFLPREDIRDVLISREGVGFDDLPEGAVVGTASLRRQALTLHLRPDLKVKPFRGNVQTRLKKLEAGEADATFLAHAGLKRLGLTHVISDIMDIDRFPSAPAQGAITIETRALDKTTVSLVEALDDPATAVCVEAERACLAALDGSCRTPIAAVAHLTGDRLTIAGQILSLDGQICFQAQQAGNRSDAQALGLAVGAQIRADAGPDFFDQLEKAMLEA